MVDVRLRDATAADITAIARLHTESWRSAYRDLVDPVFLAGPIERDRLDVWTARLGKPSPSQKVILAESDGQPIGFVCAIGGADARWGTLVDNLHVEPASKRQGIGSLLMRAAAAWAVDACSGVGLFLWCFERNTPAVRFYQRIGGVIVEQAMHDAPGGTLAPCVRLHWPGPGGLLADHHER